MLGVEAPSVADVNNLEELTEIHRILLEGDVIIVEGLANLDRIEQEQFLFAALPLKVRGGDGAPCRAFAITDLDSFTATGSPTDKQAEARPDSFATPTLPRSALESLPPASEKRPLAEVRRLLEQLDLTIVVIDDDPTGTQTVYDIPVITDGCSAHLEEAVRDRVPLIYVLTNSRSLPAAQTEVVTRELAGRIQTLSERLERKILVVSRSDSTLRGHFPLEVDVLASTLGLEEYTLVVAPFFAEGGRYTVGDIHYVQEGDKLVPAAKTPFAQDRVFGYRHSNLRRWIEEKTAGRVKAQEVKSVGIEDIREGGVERVKAILRPLGPKNPAVLNAAELADMDVAAAAILELVGEGRQFLFRTAASFVQALAGLDSRPLLETGSLGLKGEGAGVIVVGSYVPMTTSQINRLLDAGELVPIELDVKALLEEPRRDSIVHEAINRLNSLLLDNQPVVVYSSRDLVAGESYQEDLRIGRIVSAALVDVVRGIRTTPRFIIAKGGITANDIASKGLDVKCATVLGQLLNGVPVWRLEEGSRFPKVPYVVFPGNVGDENALLEAYRKLMT